MEESLGRYIARDGENLAFRMWTGSGDVIAYIHGIESNSTWFSPFAGQLNKRGFTIYGIDRRGSGLNDGRTSGHIRDYNVFLDDIEDAIRYLKDQHPGKNIFLMGICWGGLLSVNYIVKGKTAPDGLILLSPAIYRKIDLNGIIKVAAKICCFAKPTMRFKIPIMDEMFTENKKYLDFIKNDRMRLRTLTSSFFNEILRMERVFSETNHRVTLPLLLLLAGRDDIVDNIKIKEWFEKVESCDKELKTFEDFHHVMPFEDGAGEIVNFITGWIKTRESSLEGQRVKN